MKSKRKNSLRHPHWDYGNSGYYFVTICTHHRECLFDIPTFREIAELQWQKIPAIKSSSIVQLDKWVIMPNHLHGILIISGKKKENKPTTGKPRNIQSGTVGFLLGIYKSWVMRKINATRQSQEAVWQRGYYDRIIRDQTELNNIRQYIAENPARWAEDRDNLAQITNQMNHHL